MLNYSTFQTTHNNAMKNEIAVYVGNPSLSEAVQLAAFKHGFKWPSGCSDAQFVNFKILSFTKGINLVGYLVNKEKPTDYDASTEFGKIVEWFCEADKDTEIERLKREITQLRDELDAKSEESFPEGNDWHNPHGLTNEQIGVSEGWRLLLKSEVNDHGRKDELCKGIERWYFTGWDNSGWLGSSMKQTYRVKWPLPSHKNAPTSHPGTKTVSESKVDDFPTPERQEKEAGLKWFLEYLKRCKQVRGWVSGKVREVEVNHGKCGGGAELVSHNGDICLRDNYGELHRISITQINP